MTSTLATAYDAFFSILNADATFKSFLTGVGGIVLFQDIATQGAVPLYAILALQSQGADTLASPGGFRIMSNPLLKLVICGPQSQMANIDAAYARADSLLQPSGVPTRNSNGTLAIYRESPFSLTEPELVNSEPFLNYGGLYRVIL